MILKLVFSLIAVCLLGACATLQTQLDPTVGEWKYVIENLPRGEPEGTFTIAKDGDGYTGTLQRNGGDNSVPLEEIASRTAFWRAVVFRPREIRGMGGFRGGVL